MLVVRSSMACTRKFERWGAYARSLRRGRCVVRQSGAEYHFGAVAPALLGVGAKRRVLHGGVVVSFFFSISARLYSSKSPLKTARETLCALSFSFSWAHCPRAWPSWMCSECMFFFYPNQVI